MSKPLSMFARRVMVSVRRYGGQPRRLPHSQRKRLAYRLLYRAIRYGRLEWLSGAFEHYRRMAVIGAEVARRGPSDTGTDAP